MHTQLSGFIVLFAYPFKATESEDPILFIGTLLPPPEQSNTYKSTNIHDLYFPNMHRGLYIFDVLTGHEINLVTVHHVVMIGHVIHACKSNKCRKIPVIVQFLGAGQLN